MRIPANTEFDFPLSQVISARAIYKVYRRWQDFVLRRACSKRHALDLRRYAPSKTLKAFACTARGATPIEEGMGWLCTVAPEMWDTRVVTKVFSREDMWRWDPAYVDTIVYPPIGAMVLIDAMAAPVGVDPVGWIWAKSSKTEGGWMHQGGWMHPGVLQGEGCAGQAFEED